MRTWTAIGASLAAVGTLVTVFACSSSSAPPPPPVGNAGQCATGPGEFPAPNCVPFSPDAGSCTAASTTCNVSPCNANSPCLAMADNTGQSVANLRMRKLLVTAPPALAFIPPHTFVQNTVIDTGINLDNQCGEPGTGTFNWLIQFDTVNKKVTTGCAPPSTDPFGVGYCFVNAMIEGLNVGPVTVDVSQNADGSWTSSVIPKIYIPIFVASGTMGASNAPSVIVLPISKAAVHNVTLGSNNNCIGSYNSDAVTPTGPNGTMCVDTSNTTCVRWTTAGSLGGYITLDEANGVDVPQLGESLCLLLDANATVDSSNPSEKKCAVGSNGHVMATGDFCSTTDAKGGCADSFWLSATFAASAAKISSTPNEPACMGVVSGGGGGDGGTTSTPDSGAPADAATGG